MTRRGRPVAAIALALAIGLAPAAVAAPRIDWTGSSLPANVSRDRITIGGLETTLLSSGQRSVREAAVFISGFPGSSLDYVDLLSVAGRSIRAVAFDMPGFGTAAKPSPGDYAYTPRNQARFIEAALDRLRIGRVHLIGHDFGGFYGLEWASSHVPRLRSVTLINTGVLEGYAGHPFAYVSATPAVGEAFNAATPELIFKAFVDYPISNPKPLPPGLVDRMWTDYDNGTRRSAPWIYRGIGSDLFEMDDRQARGLAGNRVPALVIFGAKDPYIPARYAERQREVFPRARVHVFEDAGHYPFADEVLRTRILFKRFLAKALGPGR